MDCDRLNSIEVIEMLREIEREWLIDLERHCEILLHFDLDIEILADRDWLGRFVCDWLLLAEALMLWLRDREMDTVRLRLWLNDLVWEVLALIDRD